ncbi:MAG: hypothetical protein ACI9BW_002576 [Gammaproteobacteria bacterium]|jgi:hypothetical protein
MSEFELTETFLNHVELSMNYFMAYLSATSAFLVVAYMAGSEIPRFLARVAVMIYSLASIYLIIAFQRVAAIYVGVRDEMRGTVEWHPAIYEPSWLIPSVAWLAVVVMVLVYVCSIWFFYHVRINAHTT